MIYTLLLKPATPQNIVIGGLSGAMPPALGWAAVTESSTTGATISAEAKRLAVANLLTLEKFNDFVHEGINLMLGIATPS